MRWRTLCLALPSSVAAGWTRSESVETDLYRANAIDSDDTSVVRIRTTQGFQVTCTLTCVHPSIDRPQVHIKERSAVPPSATPLIGWRSRPRIRSGSETTTRVDLLENLLAHRREERRCSCR